MFTGGVGDGVLVTVGVAVAVAVAVGVGVPAHTSGEGPWIPTVAGDPVLKKPIVAVADCGGRLESKRKLYIVPKRIAFAFGFCAKVSELQVRSVAVWFVVQAALLNPVFPTVPSLANPAGFGGAWNPMLLSVIPHPKGTLKD